MTSGCWGAQSVLEIRENPVTEKMLSEHAAPLFTGSALQRVLLQAYLQSCVGGLKNVFILL